MNTFLTILVVAVVLFVVLYAFAPGLFEVLRVKTKAAGKRLQERVSDPVETARVHLDEAKDNVEVFEQKIQKLRSAIIQKKKQRPGLVQEVEKWENIYVSAKNAGNEDDAAKAANKLKNADLALKTADDFIKKNEALAETLQNQRDQEREALESAALQTEALSAALTGAELRNEAVSAGKNAAGAAVVLKRLEEAVTAAEADAEASQLVNGGTESLEQKYGGGDNAHNDRLAALLSKGNS